jgi:cytosine/adenosine deaminase-related metal-dependent hydrolase
VHAAEGLDAEAAAEFERLDALGCLGPNTLLVHGIAFDPGQRSRLIAAGAALVWCPSSNMRLFGRTAQVRELIANNRVALGTDSRLSGARDLFDELRLAASLCEFDEPTLEGLATHVSAAILRLPDRGALRPGLRADLLVLPAAASLRDVTRSQVRLVMHGGAAIYGDADCVIRFATGADWARARVDGTPKMLDAKIAEGLTRAGACEPGLEIAHLTGRAA